MTKVIGIVAVARANNGIGKNNDLLWHLPADMRFFKSQTSGFPVITGRKNYESIPEKYRPLPNRENIIITRNKSTKYPGAHVTHSLDEAIELAKTFNAEKVFVIGGGQIYRESLEKNLLDELLVTWVEGNFDADTFFPELDNGKWKKLTEEFHAADEKNNFDYTFTSYVKY